MWKSNDTDLNSILQIIDNYAGLANDTPPYTNAEDPFKIYNSDPNYDPASKGQHYYDFRYGDIAFFVMDTRRYRSGVSVPVEERSMLGDEQLDTFYAWLVKVRLLKGAFKTILILL